MHRKDFALAANRQIQFSQISRYKKGTIFLKNWLKETGMEKLCASFEGMYYKIV
jgi:hypothetical protein